MTRKKRNPKPDFMEEKNEFIDGVACQYLCHIQETDCAGTVFPAHFHYYIEMLYAIRGSFRVYLDHSYKAFSTGDLVLINSREIHRIDAISKDGGSYLVVRFLPDLIYNNMSQSYLEQKYLTPFTILDGHYEKIFSAALLGDSPIPRLMQDIMKEDDQKTYGYELAIKNNIGQIFLWILRYWHTGDADSFEISRQDQHLLEQLAPAIIYINRNYQKQVTAVQMAELCHISYSYFSRNFNKIIKMSYADYLNYVRISAAAKLLVSTSLPVTEIGIRVGYDASSYFIKWFRRFKQITPRQYRKQIQTSIRS